MDFNRIVNACLDSNTSRESLVDHAHTLAVLVQNIILSPAPLYRIAEWAEPYDATALGLTPAEKGSINDDRVARSLDALASSQARNLFFRLALHIIKRFELDTARIHHDTTSVTFHGQYKGSVKEPRITQGHNKDHRPDLKQLVFGLNVTGDGAVPISHEVYSGNRTDDTIHPGNVDQLRRILGSNEFIYVADSKLCTHKNLRHIADYGGSFVTVLPRTWGESKRFLDDLRLGVKIRWRKLLELEDKRRPKGPPVVYWTTADGPGTTAEGYRIIWYKSSQKVELDAKARQHAIEKAEAELYELGTRLNRGRLCHASEIRKDFKAILRRNRCQHFFKVKLAWNVEVSTRYLRPGRPRKGDPVQKVRSRLYYLVVTRDEEALKAESRTDGVFPLVTNLPKVKASKKDTLLIYKYQPYIEKRHALYKSELEVAPVYLKKPHRAVGLLDATFLAMTLDALIERELRLSMKRHGIDGLPILPEGRVSKTPTTARLLEMFSGVSWYEFKRGGEIVTFPIKLTNLQRRLIRLLGMDPVVYT